MTTNPELGWKDFTCEEWAGLTCPQWEQLRCERLPEPDYMPPCDDECCPTESSSSCSGGSCDMSSFPVRYANGALQLAVTDLSASGFGQAWQHRRSYQHRLSRNYDFGNGTNWQVGEWPYLIEHADDSITVVRGSQDALWFDLDNGSYTGRFGTRSRLVHDPIAQQFELQLPTGSVLYFHDFQQSSHPAGRLAQQQEPGGHTTTVESYTPQGRIQELRRSGLIGTDTVTEAFRYDYHETGPQAGRLAAVTLRRTIDQQDWTDIRRAVYEYYDGSDAHGSPGDLKRVRVQAPTDQDWQDEAVHYYRYYTSGGGAGFQHGLKYVIEPQSYARLSEQADPLTANDTLIAQYADYYFEYDADRRVTKERVQGGTQTFTFSYTDSTNTAAPNHWHRKTVETRPDESQTIVYTNYVGQVLVKEFRSGSDRWIESLQYDSDWRAVLHASPSAVLDYDDAEADLDVSLNEHDGLIRLTEYYATTGSGAAAGYVSAEKLKRGSEGTPVLLHEYEYASRTVDGVTVHPLSKQTDYRNDDGSGPLVTTSSHSWHADTLQVRQRTTTFPVVPTEQNGSGTSATRIDEFDTRGQLVWQQDARGVLTRFEHDLETGAIVQRIDDVDTTQVGDAPDGWTTPSGGGAHLITDYEHDAHRSQIRL